MWFALFLAACCLPFSGSDDLEELRAELIPGGGTTLAVATADAPPAIPPLRPGELAPPPSQSGSGLQILGVAPQGDGRDPSQVAVVFDRPMVALDQIDATSATVPVTCSPEIPGRARWAGTTTAVLVPDGNRFPLATEFRCQVAAGAAATDGTRLEETVAWAFSTARPAIERTRPTEGAADWDPKEPLVLRFNQPVDPAAIAGHVELRTETGQVVALSLGRGSEKLDKPEIVLARGELAADTAYVLTLKEGLRGAGGPLPLVADHVVRFRTYPPLTVAETSPAAQGVDPFEPIRVKFSTRVPAQEVNARIHVDPAPPDGWKPAESYESDEWSAWTRLAPRTTYTVKLDPGVKDVHGQALAEGRTWTFSTGDLPPLLDAPEAFLVYPASNPTTLPFRHRNVSEVEVSFERVDPLAVAMATGDDAREAWRTVGGGVTQTNRYLPEPALNEVRRSQFDMAPVLVGGRGLVRVRARSPEVKDWQGRPAVATALLQVTDLGTTLKLGPDGVAVWVTRLSDGKPVGDAHVQLVARGKLAWTGKTDAQGLAWAAGDVVPNDFSRWNDSFWVLVRHGDDAALTSQGWDEGMEGWDHSVSAWFDDEQVDLQVEMFKDRDVFRPGETAHVQVIAREKSLKGLVAPKRRELTWALSDPNDQPLSEGKGVLDDFGAWSIDLPTPKEGALGDHRLELDFGGGDRDYVWINVKAYRAPAFRVELAAPATAALGEALQATVHGRYLFGAPMTGATAKWSIWREPLAIAPPGFEDFSFEPLPAMGEWAAPEGEYGEVASGHGELDATGALTLRQAVPADLKRPTVWQIEGTVDDVDRQSLSNRASVDVHVAETYTGVRTRSFVATAGEPVTVEVVTATPGGEARSGLPVTLTVARRTWDSVREKSMDGTWRWVTTPKDEPAGGGTVSSGKQATAWSFTPADGGYYVVRAEGKDPAGRATTAEVGVWVAGGDVAWARDDSHKLELVPEQRRWKPGDTAKILVKAPKPGMQALVTVEREGIWSRRVVTLKGTADRLEVPITLEMMPNAFVSVVAVEGAPAADSPDAGRPAVWYGVLDLPVDAKGQKADVVVKTDKEDYQPRDTVEIRLDAKRDGKPLANARVTLWAVDHGVLSLTDYQVPDLHTAYYRPRSLNVVTADNRISVYDRAHYLQKGVEAGGGGGDKDGDTRKRFETTPLWAPNLRTGNDGTLVHRFQLPDNLTTFRIMAVVDDGGTAFGAGKHEVRVNRPLIARPALPRFFRDGDKVLAGVVVHNNTEAAAEIEVRATVTGATLRGAPRKVKVDAHGAKEVPFGLTAFTGTDVRFRFEAEGGGNKDAVELVVPVVPALAQEVVATAGSTMGEAKETVAKPQGALPGVGGLTVQASASALVGMGASLDYLVDYPHGCLEQTGSRLRVAMLAKELGARAGVETPAEKLDDVIRVGLAEMDRYATPSGGYAYWPGDSEASGLASAYAIEVLTDARRAGHAVDAARLDGLEKAVRAFLAGKDIPRWWSEEQTFAAQSRAALALARAGRGDAAFNTRVWDRRAKLPLFAKAQLSESIARTTGADSRTRALATDLEASLHVEAADAALLERGEPAWQALWYGDDVGTAALVRAWTAAGGDHPLLPRLVHHLVKARQQGRWSNTYATAEALSALSAWVAGHETGAVTADVSLAGQSILAGDLGLGGQKSVAVPMVSLSAGDLLLRATGGRLYYETRLAYALPELPPRDEGFTLTRTYEVLEGSGTGGQVAPGSLVRVTLRVVTPVDRYNVALVDWLPAGLEPVDTSFATTARSLGRGSDTGQGRYDRWDTGSTFEEPEYTRWMTSKWVFDRRELHDDHVAVYAERMPAGIHVQTYLARATTPGDYAHPAATVEEMYAPETFGRTPSGRFVVGAPIAGR